MILSKIMTIRSTLVGSSTVPTVPTSLMLRLHHNDYNEYICLLDGILR